MGRERQRTGVRPASASSIQIAFTYRGIPCRERIKLQPTTANLKRAEQHRGAILDAIERGTFDYAKTFPESPNRFLFAEQKGAGYKLEIYLETWLGRQTAHLKASTLDDYKKIVMHTLIPEIGQTYITDLKRAQIRDLCEKSTASNKRLSNIQSVLRKALHDAIDDDLIETNPLYGWKYARKEAPKTIDDIAPFTAEEQTEILNACREPQCRNLFQFAFWSGLRTSELIALEWGDIDWQRGIVRVSRAKTQASDTAEGTKTRRGTRDVKLLAPAISALTAQKSHTHLAGGAVFHNPRTGEPWTGDQPIRHGAWTAALKKAGIRYRRPYQTRHTYASMMLSAGESPMWVAAQMGHADWSMIGRVYGRWIRDAAPEAGNKAVEMFGAQPKKEAALKLR